LSHFEKPGDDESIDPDPSLEYAVKQKIVFAAVRDLAEHIAPDRQSRHESRKHRRDGIRRIAENLRQHTSPHDLVDQTGDAGKEKTKESNNKKPFLL